MSTERKIDPFSVMILVIGILGIVLLAPFDFAAFYLGAGNYRYSCLSCEYATGVDLTAQIIILILFIVQIVIALNELLPNKFIDKDLGKFGMGLAVLTFLFAIIGIASFGITYSNYEWWPELGFYSSLIGGILNTVLFFLQDRNK
ncbi:MAG: hypothetical protein ACFFDB_06430 [Promethearchaeota archaeon]